MKGRQAQRSACDDGSSPTAFLPRGPLRRGKCVLGCRPVPGAVGLICSGSGNPKCPDSAGTSGGEGAPARPRAPMSFDFHPLGSVLDLLRICLIPLVGFIKTCQFPAQNLRGPPAALRGNSSRLGELTSPAAGSGLLVSAAFPAPDPCRLPGPGCPPPAPLPLASPSFRPQEAPSLDCNAGVGMWVARLPGTRSVLGLL